jgi:hypothetical protein
MKRRAFIRRLASESNTTPLVIRALARLEIAAAIADPVGGTPKEFANFIRADIEKWGRGSCRAQLREVNVDQGLA